MITVKKSWNELTESVISISWSFKLLVEVMKKGRWFHLHNWSLLRFVHVILLGSSRWRLGRTANWHRSGGHFKCLKWWFRGPKNQQQSKFITYWSYTILINILPDTKETGIYIKVLISLIFQPYKDKKKSDGLKTLDSRFCRALPFMKQPWGQLTHTLVAYKS